MRSALEHYRKARKGLDELATGGSGQLSHPQYVTRVLDELAAGDAIFSCDVGTPTVWAARYLTMNGKRRLLGSFTHGSMANALPQAIGAQVSHPGRQVVSLSGDGGLAMLMGELLSLRQLQLPVKVIGLAVSSGVETLCPLATGTAFVTPESRIVSGMSSGFRPL